MPARWWCSAARRPSISRTSRPAVRPAFGRMANVHARRTSRRRRRRTACARSSSSTASSGFPATRDLRSTVGSCSHTDPQRAGRMLLTRSDGRTLLVAPLDAFHEQTIGLNGGTLALRLARRPGSRAGRVHYRPCRARRRRPSVGARRLGPDAARRRRHRTTGPLARRGRLASVVLDRQRLRLLVQDRARTRRRRIDRRRRR